VSEAFLHYIWQFQYFDKKELTTTTDERLSVFKPGILNHDSGPDFSNAKIQIGDMEWAGSVEIHLDASGWTEHGHHHDVAYENVILHVVWQEDKPIFRNDGSRIPTLALNNKVDQQLISEYRKLVNNPVEIPCQKSFQKIDHVVKASMIDKALMMRLETKANQISKLLNRNLGDWEETTYQLLAANFGFKVNQQSFQQLANVLPYKLIQKHRNQIKQIEAMLFGLAGFLVSKTKEEYVTELFTEYQFLAKKYSLQPNQLLVSQWKFLRLRPMNFPTLRIAQFASLVGNRSSLFVGLTEANSFKELEAYFKTDVSPYWQTHYRFGRKAKDGAGSLGDASIQLLIINTVLPLLVAYGRAKDDWAMVEKAVDFLQQVPSEKNKIITIWKNLGYTSKNAADSQGLIELYNNYCQRRACLNCSVGAAILKPVTAI
jgi:hypothetical protein